ncbi:diguanylate cyclase [Acaryochloris sp. IP29b_bin.148]|uniref:diguanylate cyclase domain-containing protein n=1 Tax=Acaryochloris sp. IP29b_bin.148 TaxID=2969218 RepID=UPI002608F477|nr:diguanylate cyclase [Acaryochloris sp. IP29b_bin.148]
MHSSSTQILIIEDNVQDVEIVRELLDIKPPSSVALEHRETLSAGIDFLQVSNATDLVLLDLSLPDAFGLDTFHHVREAFPNIPLIILSGDNRESTAMEALQDGAQDFLVKGRFNSSTLHRSIHYALERQRQRLELEYKNLALASLSQQLEDANRELEHLATVDGLTQISNRRRFDEVFLSEWNRLHREEQPLSLILCDVDHFKAYNDTYGHPAGDTCLQLVAQAICKVVKRPADCVARYGGEEFGVILPHTDLAGAVFVAEAIRDQIRALNLPHAASSVSNQVSLSLGVACQTPNSDIAPSVLISSADRALYVAKAQGRDRVEAYPLDQSEPNFQSHQPPVPASRLHRALEENLFQLYAQTLQPLEQQQDKRCFEFEVSLRLCDQPGQVIAPEVFFPVAERHDLTTRLDRWTIQHLFTELRQIQTIMQQDVRFFIRLSEASCQNNELLDFLQNQLMEHKLQAQQFCFEIPEVGTLDHQARVVAFSQGLNAMGFKVALDEFGNSPSSFQHLKGIAADFVKIDGLFIKEMASDPVSNSIVAAIHQVAETMGLQTIANQVESQAIRDSLQGLGIHYGQGHFYDQATPLIESMVACQFYLS